MRKSVYGLLCVAILMLLSLTGFAEGKALTLTVMHINDTHAHLDPTVIKLKILTNEQDLTKVEAGGFARVAAKVSMVRAAKKNTLLLDGGDVFSGTLYFTQNLGMADLELMKYMKFDAMVPGNHEFDKGPSVLASFINAAGKNMPVISANIDASAEPLLKDKILPYTIKNFDGESVAIIGLTTPETPTISSPGETLKFKDLVQSVDIVQALVKQLNEKGINKIILLTHIGYKEDLAMAQKVSGIDLIVGGHSHTLLGNFAPLTLAPEGNYPTVVTNLTTKEAVYVVQSWEWEKVFGQMDIQFDAKGRIVEAVPEDRILISGNLIRDNKINTNKNYTKEETAALQTAIAQSGTVEIVPDDPAALKILEPYTKGIAELNKQIVGKAEDNLSKPVMGQIIADSLIWKSRQIGQDVRISFVNIGGVRTDIPQGDISVGKVYEVQPFGNTLFIMDLTGAQVKDALEQGASKGYPYVGGIRYTVETNNAQGSRVTSVELLNTDGSYGPLKPDSVFRAAMQNFLASGGDNFTVFKAASGYRYDTGFIDADVLMEYLKNMKSWNARDAARTIIK